MVKLSYQTKKHCRKCNENLPLDNFYPDKIKSDGYSAYCKKCNSMRAKTYFKIHGSTYDYFKRIESVYGVTKAVYYQMLRTQHNRCYICQKQFDDIKIPVVDHDHNTNIVRGLLCRICNRNLGWLENNQDVIREYLNNGDAP